MGDAPWSVRAADSVMQRRRGFMDKWIYDYHLVLRGIELAHAKTGDGKYYEYIRRTMDFMVNEDGTIYKYALGNFSVDYLNGGRNLLYMIRQGAGEKYKKAAALLRRQIAEQPRVSDGAFWHKRVYPHQIWLDGLYMASPFYAEYIKEIEGGTDFSDVTKQFLVSFKHCYNERTGLLHHAYDETKSQFWCDPQTGLSHNYWGRSIGWYVMALIDVLAVLPEGDKDRAALKDMLRKVIGGMARHMDGGVWWQVVDQKDRVGNYKEASVSIMMLYGLCRGILDGHLDKAEWLDTAKAVRDAVLREFVTIQAGRVNVNKICEVGGLGWPGEGEFGDYYGEFMTHRRDGSFEYYISEPIVSNDPKGVGSFMLAMNAAEALFGE